MFDFLRRLITPSPKTQTVRRSVGGDRRSRASGANGYSRAGSYSSYSKWTAGDNQSRTPTGRQFTELRIIQNRARSLYHNSPHARSLVETFVDLVVGEQPPRLIINDPRAADRHKQKIPYLFKLWSRDPANFDLYGRLSLYQMCLLVVRSIALDGEAFIRVHHSAQGVRFEFIDARRIPTYSIPRSKSKGTLRVGAEVDSRGKVVAWAINPEVHDGFNYIYPDATTSETEMVSASKIIHIYDPGEASQLRGDPLIEPVMVQLRTMLDYEQAALRNATFGAEKIGIVKGGLEDADAGLQPTLDDGDSDAEFNPELTQCNSIQTSAGDDVTVYASPQGMTFERFDTNYPDSQYKSFIESVAHSIAAGVGVAHHSLSGDLGGVNFASGRIGEQSQLRRARKLRILIESGFIQSVVLNWTAYAMGAGLINMKEAQLAQGCSIYWTRATSIDPLKKQQADALEIANGTKSRAEIISDDGRDPQTVFDLIEREAEMNKPPPQEDKPEDKPEDTDEEPEDTTDDEPDDTDDDEPEDTDE